MLLEPKLLLLTGSTLGCLVEGRSTVGALVAGARELLTALTETEEKAGLGARVEKVVVEEADTGLDPGLPSLTLLSGAGVLGLAVTWTVVCTDSGVCWTSWNWNSPWLPGCCCGMKLCCCCGLNACCGCGLNPPGGLWNPWLLFKNKLAGGL